jgi:hypothetical protein
MVVAVSVDVCAVAPLMVTEAGERLHVVGLVAPEGDAVTAQVSVTVPVNEFSGVTVMVVVLLEPGLTVKAPLFVRVKLAPPGACQKFAQPARRPAKRQATAGAAASKDTRAHRPILIAAPFP